ncbi:MAG: hypothetical protein OXJ37_03400 [Bryobacterales bacterium]|nr:hypothetical protein [Bryobacterales bacterium]
MRHGKLDRDTAQGLKELRRRLEADGNRVPPSILDETMNLATWNIREFGRRARLPKSLHYIAEVIGRFDLVALTEVRRDLNELLRVMDLLPPFWDFVVSDYSSDRAANKERVAYVFDKRVVRFTGLAAEADPPRKRNKDGRYKSSFTWWRAPYIASFRSGNFDFVVVTVHLRWGSGEMERLIPLKELAKWARKRSRDECGFDRDLLVVGDMNIPSRQSELFRAVGRYGLKLPGALAELRESKATTNLSRKAVYDQILHHATNPCRFTNNSGERALRMAKTKIKVSGCFRTQAFGEAYARISSYLQSMAALGYNPLVAIQIALAGQAADMVQQHDGPTLPEA